MIDGSILRSLGLMLQRDEARVARPVAVPVPVKTVCAWCHREQGQTPSPNESHGICARHLAGMRSELEQRRRVAA